MISPNDDKIKMKAKKEKDERGFVLVIAILLLLVVTLLGVSGISTTNHDNLISGNKRIGQQAFYVAEAGVDEFLSRFRQGVTGAISDSAPTNPNWKVFIALNRTRAESIGYSSGDANHTFVQSLQNLLDFAVEVKHKVNIANNVITKAGNPVYIVKSYGVTSEGGNRTIEVELQKCPNLDPPASLYSEQPIDINGSSTYIQGLDQCGTNNKPGILTTLPSSDPSAIDINGSPTINGTPSIQYNGQNLPLRETIDYLKNEANFKYSFSGNTTLTGYSDSWGNPTSSGTESPLSYTGPMMIVYFKMDGNTTLKLAGGSHGAGILIVDGNLELNGGFKWYGLIIVMGALDYTGGGDKNVTGGILTGESATVEVDIGGNAGIIYCSSVADQIKQTVKPVKITQWRDIF